MVIQKNGLTWTDTESHYLDKTTNSWVAASTATTATTTQYNGNTWTPDGTLYLDKSTNKWVKAPAQWETTSSSSLPPSLYTSQPQGQTLGYNNVTNMTGLMYSTFQQAPNPTAAAPKRKCLVKQNMQTPGKPATPYVPLNQEFIAAGSQSFLIGSFVKAYHKLFRGQV